MVVKIEFIVFWIIALCSVVVMQPPSTTLKIEAAQSSKPLISSQYAACCNNPENHKFCHYFPVHRHTSVHNCTCNGLQVQGRHQYMPQSLPPSTFPFHCSYWLCVWNSHSLFFIFIITDEALGLTGSYRD